MNPRKVLAWVAGSAFFLQAATSLSHWGMTEGWRRGSLIAALIGGPLLILSHQVPTLPRWSGILARILLVLAAANLIDGLAFFILMRLKIPWYVWIEFAFPIAALAAYYLTPRDKPRP